MPKYIDGYVLPVPKKHIDAYRRIATKAGKIWREHGALEYRECAAEDLEAAKKMGLMPFTQCVKAKPGETVFFSWIVFKSRAHRDRVNARVMKDPRIHEGVDPNKMPFDHKRMAYGGFTALVDLRAVAAHEERRVESRALKAKT